MSNKNNVSDVLRNRLMKTHLKKEVESKTFPPLNEIGGIEYLIEEIDRKIHFPLFFGEKYFKWGVEPVKCVLVYGISGVGKNFIINSYANQHKIPIIKKYFETAADVRETFRKAETATRAIVLMDKIEDFEEEKHIMYQIKECIKSAPRTVLTVLLHKNKNIALPYENEIFVKIPTDREREEILRRLLRGTGALVDFGQLAHCTPGFVPRMLEKLVKVAVGNHCKLAVENEERQLTTKDFTDVLSEWKRIVMPVTFDDIGAMENVKEELKMSILLPSKFPEKFRRLGIVKPSGVLLHGPPGCGKTLIAKAVSNMSHCNFLSIKGPELITKYVGDSEKHLRDLFEKAKNLSPCVLFFDEIDSLCGQRGQNEFGNRIVNQVLTLLDGMEDRGEVYLIGATNRISHIDRALLRPGRFDKVVEVSLPTREEALLIFKKCIEKIPVDPFDYKQIPLDGCTGAEISGIVKEAALTYLKENFDVETPLITAKYFIEASHKLISMRNNR